MTPGSSLATMTSEEVHHVAYTISKLCLIRHERSAVYVLHVNYILP
jgi:hypothetical protein